MTTRLIDYSMIHHIDRIGRWDDYPSFSGAVLDSRQAFPGCLFIARKGDHADGNRFINQAVEKGAAFVVAENGAYVDKRIDVPVLITDAPVRTLLDLVEALRALTAHQRIVAVTGSYGKTTTKDFIHSALSSLYKTGKTEGNLNNEWGVPLTFFNNFSREVVVMELGMDHFGDIGILAKALKPDIGVITGISPVHMEYLQTLDRVYAGKVQLFEMMDPKAVKLVYGDDPRLAEAGKVFERVLSYGRGEGCDYRVGPVTAGKGEVHFELNGEPYRIPAWSVNYAFNAAAAVAVALNMGVSPGQIRTGLEKCVITGGRFTIREEEGLLIVDDTYNSSPATLKAVLEEISARFGSFRKLFCLGDMLELGQESKRYHREALELCRRIPRSQALLLGPEFYALKEEFPQFAFFKDRREYAGYLREIGNDYSLLLFKGSRGMRMEEFIHLIREEK